MSADGRAESAPHDQQPVDELPGDVRTPLPPMSVLLAAGAAAEAVCTPPTAPAETPAPAEDRPGHRDAA